MGNFLNNIRLDVTNRAESDFILTTRNSRRATAEEILQTEFKLKDTIEIPIQGEQHTFVVEHIRPLGDGRRKVYFVSKNIIGKSSMFPEHIIPILDDFEENMPREIVDIMETIEHKRFGFELTRKLNLLSSANLQGADRHEGYDDILFGGLEAKIDRCKMFRGANDWWFLCDLRESSPNINDHAYFNVTLGSGYISYYGMDNIFGVVPSFSIITFNADDQKVRENIA